jgi:hypothetical protein
MKRLFFSVAIASLVLFACKKPNSPGPGSGSLDGKWRMVLVKDNSTGLTTAKPVSVQGDVDITFTSISPANGSLAGNTPTNSIAQNNYSTGANQSLNIPALNMTKVTETSWGEEFVDNICKSQAYSFETDGKLSIKTLAKTLTFMRQ